MTEEEFRDRVLVQLTRIADALERPKISFNPLSADEFRRRLEALKRGQTPLPTSGKPPPF